MNKYKLYHRMFLLVFSLAFFLFLLSTWKQKNITCSVVCPIVLMYHLLMSYINEPCE